MEPLGATTVILVICVSCLLFLSAWRKSPGRGKLPPGPVAFPLIGNMLQLNAKNLLQSVCKLRETYGPVFTIYLGSERVVVLFGYEAVKEGLIDHGEEFAGRGRIPVFEKIFTRRGLRLDDAKSWKQLRRFTLSTLKDFGLGKKSIEEQIQEEGRFLVERLGNTHGRPFDPSLFLTHVVSNVICSIVFGDRFDYEDQKFVTLISLIKEIEILQFSSWAKLYSFFPTLMDYVPGPHQRIFQHAEELRTFILERVERHRESLDPSCPRDFIDAFLIKIKQEEQNGQSEFTTENLLKRTLLLFFAGTGTVSVFLKHGLLLLMKYPEIEEKVHVEIDQAIGRNRSPCMADRSQMPYTDAVIHEILRFTVFNPLGIPRSVTRDTRFRQYVIPKGTTVFPILHSILYDKKKFPNPEQFNPGHFLDANGAFKKSDFFVPFSIGKRSCTGEGLAQMELFLILTTILQNFTLKPLVDPKDLDVTPMCFASDASLSYQLIVTPQ